MTLPFPNLASHDWRTLPGLHALLEKLHRLIPVEIGFMPSLRDKVGGNRSA
jgi:hypothetical protein